jgi:hypothetical protein
MVQRLTHNLESVDNDPISPLQGDFQYSIVAATFWQKGCALSKVNSISSDLSLPSMIWVPSFPAAYKSLLYKSIFGVNCTTKRAFCPG